MKLKITALILILVLTLGCVGIPMPQPTSTPTPSITPTSKVTPTPTTTPIITSMANLVVHFIDVGQGDSVLIQTPNGKNLLIDGGELEYGSRVVSYLQNQGIKQIDVLIATHPHSDHIGGLLAVLDKLPVSKAIDSGQLHTSQLFESYLQKIDQKNIPFSIARSGQAIEVDNSISIKVLNPSEPLISGTSSDLNENSIVLLLKYGQISFLLTGDAGFYAEERVINALEHIDILKVGHHGSAYATSNELLNKINPESAIISVGSNNNYGHPAPETLNRLTQHNVKIYRTDVYGTMKITTDGNTYHISS